MGKEVRLRLNPREHLTWTKWEELKKFLRVKQWDLNRNLSCIEKNQDRKQTWYESSIW